ncbi:MAG: CDP-diacylglycerol--glycerol-3-phosphate 3-phosphatidyltransferase [Bacillales bacterium]
MKKINLPTKITISRIFLSLTIIILLIIFYLLDEFKIIQISNYTFQIKENVQLNYLLIILFILFIIASLTDFLDGYLARKYKLVTDLGKFLDPLADKMLINSLMIFLAINFKSMQDFAKFPWFCVIFMIFRDLTVDGLRFMAASKNKVLAANIYGKAKTVIQMFTISLILLNGFPFSFFDRNFINYFHITDIFAYITTFISLLSGFIYLKNNKDIFNQ